MKDSGVEWIGEIPSEWNTKKLKYQCDIIYGISPPDTTYNDEGIGIELVNGPVEYSDTDFGYTRSLKWTTEPKKTTTKGSLLFCLRGSTTGRMNITHKDLSIGRGVCSINSRESQWFMIYSMMILRIHIQKLISGSTFPSITKDDVDNYIICHPPLKEQTQIVSFLDTKTQKIDDLIQKTEKKIELLKEKRLKLVEGVLLNPNTKRIRLEYVVDLVKRPIEREENNTYTKIGMYNWGKGIFKYPSELGSELGDSSFFYLKEGDLLLSGQFSWEGSVSIVEKEENNCISSHRFHILNGKEGKVLNEYLWSYFTSQEGHFILNENSFGSSGRNRPLNIGKLLKEKIPIPDMDIQMEIKSLVIETKNFERYSKVSSPTSP